MATRKNRRKESGEIEVTEDLLKKADVSKSMFGSSPEEDREFLQLFSFICLLSFDVYLKKQMNTPRMRCVINK